MALRDMRANRCSRQRAIPGRAVTRSDSRPRKYGRLPRSTPSLGAASTASASGHVDVLHEAVVQTDLVEARAEVDHLGAFRSASIRGISSVTTEITRTVSCTASLYSKVGEQCRWGDSRGRHQVGPGRPSCALGGPRRRPSRTRSAESRRAAACSCTRRRPVRHVLRTVNTATADDQREPPALGDLEQRGAEEGQVEGQEQASRAARARQWLQRKRSRATK